MEETRIEERKNEEMGEETKVEAKAEKKKSSIRMQKIVANL